MPKRVSPTETKKRSTAKSRRLSKALKKYWARVRQIKRHEPDLTLKEARSRDRETISETIAKGVERAFKTWQRVATTKTGKGIYREVDKGKVKQLRQQYDRGEITRRQWLDASDQAVTGRRRSQEFVRRSQRQLSRWELVYRTARRFQMGTMEAARFLKRLREEMQATAYRYGKRRRMRMRDAAYVAEWTDRYENVRLEFGI